MTGKGGMPLNNRRNFGWRLGRIYLLRVVMHGYKLPKEVLGSPSLEVCEANLDGALSSLSWRGGNQPTAVSWNYMGF